MQIDFDQFHFFLANPVTNAIAPSNLFSIHTAVICILKRFNFSKPLLLRPAHITGHGLI